MGTTPSLWVLLLSVYCTFPYCRCTKTVPVPVLTGTVLPYLGKRIFPNLSDIIDGVILHGFDEGESVLVAGAGAGDAQRHGRPVPHVRVVRLRQQLHHTYTNILIYFQLFLHFPSLIPEYQNSRLSAAQEMGLLYRS